MCKSLLDACCNFDVVKGSGCDLNTFTGFVHEYMCLKSADASKKSINSFSFSYFFERSKGMHWFVKYPVVLYFFTPGFSLISF